MDTLAGGTLRPEAKTFKGLVRSKNSTEQDSRLRALDHHCGSCVIAEFKLTKDPQLLCPIHRFPGKMIQDVPFGEISSCPDYFEQNGSKYAQVHANFLTSLKFKEGEYKWLFSSLVSSGISFDALKSDLVTFSEWSDGGVIFYSSNRFGAESGGDFVLETESFPNLTVGSELIGRFLPGRTFLMNLCKFDDSCVNEIDLSDPEQRKYISVIQTIWDRLFDSNRVKLEQQSWLALP